MTARGWYSDPDGGGRIPVELVAHLDPADLHQIKDLTAGWDWPKKRCLVARLLAPMPLLHGTLPDLPAGQLVTIMDCQFVAAAADAPGSLGPTGDDNWLLYWCSLVVRRRDHFGAGWHDENIGCGKAFEVLSSGNDSDNMIGKACHCPHCNQLYRFVADGDVGGGEWVALAEPWKNWPFPERLETRKPAVTPQQATPPQGSGAL